MIKWLSWTASCHRAPMSSNNNLWFIVQLYADPWWCHQMETFSALLAFVRGIISHRWIPAKRPVTQSFDVFFDLPLNKRLSKRWRRLWFETPSCSLWRHCIFFFIELRYFQPSVIWNPVYMSVTHTIWQQWKECVIRCHYRVTCLFSKLCNICISYNCPWFC